MKKLLRFYKNLRTFLFTFLTKISLRNMNAKIKANGFTRLTPNTTTGTNVHFNGFTIYGTANVYIGNNFHSGKGCKIITDIHNYNGTKLPYDNIIISKTVVIEDNVWLGMDVTILGGVTIGEGAIIQAGSVIVNSIEKLSIAGGHPAKIFSHRNKNHYDDLNKKQSFF